MKIEYQINRNKHYKDKFHFGSSKKIKHNRFGIKKKEKNETVYVLENNNKRTNK